jgi:hypothetical protein
VGLTIRSVSDGPTHGSSLGGARDDSAERAGRCGDECSSCDGGGAARAAGNGGEDVLLRHLGTRLRRPRAGCGPAHSPLSLPEPTLESGDSSACVPTSGAHSGPANFQELFIKPLVTPPPCLSQIVQGTDLPRVSENMYCGTGCGPEAPSSRRWQWPRTKSKAGEQGTGSQARPLSRVFSIKALGSGRFYKHKSRPHP